MFTRSNRSRANVLLSFVVYGYTHLHVLTLWNFERVKSEKHEISNSIASYICFQGFTILQIIFRISQYFASSPGAIQENEVSIQLLHLPSHWTSSSQHQHEIDLLRTFRFQVCFDTKTLKKQERTKEIPAQRRW